MATIAPARPAVEAPKPTAQSGVRTSHPFTCNACQVAFRNSELQRTHMHSDWHRYNLKRRVASLPPISSEVFAEKVVSAQASSSAAAAKASFERACHVCQRTYYSENAFQNHIGSQKHKLRLAAQQARGGPGQDTETGSLISSTFSLGEPIESGEAAEVADPDATAEFSKVVDAMKESSISEVEPVERRPSRPHHSAEDERPPHPLSPATTQPNIGQDTDESTKAALMSCLFCNYRSPSLPLNVSHMSKFHGMFIPEQSYLVDEPGLVEYLHRKVFEVHECLHCGKVKGTVSGVQTHMRDKGHCMIGFESEEQMIEIGQYYDFRSTYSDADEEEDDDDDVPLEKAVEADKSGGGVKSDGNGEEQADVALNGDGNKAEGEDDDGDGWETDTSASSLDSAELTAVPLDHRHQYERLDKHPHHSSHDPRPHHLKDGWHSHAHHVHPHAVYYSDYELHLPSGRAVGHRSLARYYRQNLRDYPSSAGNTSMHGPAAIEDGHDADEAQDNDQNEDTRARGRQLTTTRRNELGMTGLSDARRKQVTVLEQRERRKENRDRARYRWAVEKKGNTQRHYRDPLLQ